MRRAALALGLALAPTAMPMTAVAEVIETDAADVFVTRDEAVVPAAPYDAWRQLVAVDEWWNPQHTWSGAAGSLYLSAQAGGCFCELLPERDDLPEGVRRGSAQHMVVVQADPPRVLRMRGALGPLQSEPAEGVLTITMRPDGKGTRIVWEYVVGGATRYERDEIAEAVDAVMSEQLARFAAKLGGPRTRAGG